MAELIDASSEYSTGRMFNKDNGRLHKDDGGLHKGEVGAAAEQGAPANALE
jgi:hypothetical protein